MTLLAHALPLVEPKRLTFEVFLSCIPPTASHHAKKIVRVGKWTRLADKPDLVQSKSTLDELLMPHQLDAPIPSPVVMSVVFTWPWLKGHSKRFRAAGRQPHTSKPDLSNVVKTLEDRLVQLLFIEDDRSVVELHLQKWWGNTPGIQIAITEACATSRWMAVEVRP